MLTPEYQTCNSQFITYNSTQFLSSSSKYHQNQHFIHNCISFPKPYCFQQFFELMKFKEPMCKIQLVIKDQYKLKKTQKIRLHGHDREKEREQEHCEIRWNMQKYSKSDIVEDILQTECDVKNGVNKKNRVLEMMSKIVNQFKKQRSKSNSERRSKSPKKREENMKITKTNLATNSQKDILSKVNLLKQMKASPQALKLKGLTTTQMIPSRPVSAYDLQNRLKPSQRALTAKTTQTNTRSIQRGSSSRSIVSARKHGRVMSFNPKDYQQEYKKKLKIFLDYLYKVNFSNGLYRDLQLLPIQAPLEHYKIYLGKGNNYQLLKQLLKRRFWYELTSNKEEYCHFYWTQSQLPQLHQIQICMNSRDKQAQKPHELMQSLVMSKQFGFRNELNNERTRLNCKIMAREQAEEVQQLINSNGHTIFSKPFQFITMTNHIPGTSAFTQKKNLLNNLKRYYEDVLDEDPFTIIPKSFHLVEYKGYEIQFFQHLANQDPNKLWIIKPGEDSCRCEGIQIFPAPQILKRIRERWQEEEESGTFIIQSYIQNPLLYYQRKFDIRHYMLMTCINGHLKAYWYRQGYVRTSSAIYPLVTKIKCKNPLAKKFKNEHNQQLLTWLKKKYIHYMNDVIQIQHEDYGKHEPGNKLSYGDLQKYFDYQHAEYPFFDRVLPQMKEIALQVLKSVKGQIDPQRRACNFEIFGLDFILDEDFKVWLLEINTNPSFKNNSPVLDRVIPGVLEQVIRLCVDPLLPPRNHFPAQQQHTIPPDSLAALQFELFYEQ